MIIISSSVLDADQDKKDSDDDCPSDHGNLFHTYLQAVGVDSTDSFDVEGRDVPIADPASKMIRQILA